MSNIANIHVVLTQRPGADNEPTEKHFKCEETPYPSEKIEPGQLVLKTLYLSVDPALRCRMNEDTGVDYVGPWPVGDSLSGFGGVGQVIESSDPSFSKGDLVVNAVSWPWKLYFVISGNTVKKLPKEIHDCPSYALSVLGGTGLTAYLGITEKANIVKGANQCMVVSAAAGSTGSIAGQVAKVEGCGFVVGICGSDQKCKCLTEELGFDAAINYKTDSVTDRLASLCPEGVDIYFDNVGGDVSDQIIASMKQNGNVVLCGQIAVYNKDLPYPPPLPENTAVLIKEKNITRERFLVFNYQNKFESSIEKLSQLIQSGQIKVKETIEHGLENAGKAFVSMMNGGNVGKQLVKT